MNMTSNMPLPQDPGDQGQDQTRAGFLHVIFHGLFCYFERPNDIMVRIPRVEHTEGHTNFPEHVYMAGNWLGEQALAPTFYKLKGVLPGSTHFRSRINFRLEG